LPSYLMSTKLVSYFFLRLAGRLGSTASSVPSGVSVSGCDSATSTTSGCSTRASTGATSAITGAVATGGVSNHSGSAGTLTSGAVPYPSIFPLLSLLLSLYHE
jgi:hypothetical protein